MKFEKYLERKHYENNSNMKRCRQKNWNKKWKIKGNRK